MNQQQEVILKKILRCGRKTYFFDVKLAKNDNKYLKITESSFVKEGEARIRNSFVLFKDHLKGFVKIMKDIEGRI